MRTPSTGRPSLDKTTLDFVPSSLIFWTYLSSIFLSGFFLSVLKDILSSASKISPSGPATLRYLPGIKSLFPSASLISFGVGASIWETSTLSKAGGGGGGIPASIDSL